MTVRYEWISLLHPFLHAEIVRPGTEVGEHETDTYGLVISYDEAVVIEGDLDDLRAFLNQCERAITEEADRAYARSIEPNEKEH